MSHRNKLLAVIMTAMFLFLSSCTGDTGPTDQDGPLGVAGSIGQDGPPGIADYEIVSQSVTLPGYDPGLGYDLGTTFTVNCPSGKLVLGGGIDTGDDQGNIKPRDSYPKADGTGWTLSVFNANTAQREVVGYAICAVVK